MKPSHGVVGAWAAGNVVLALVHLAFHPRPLPFFLYIAGSAIVAGFGLAVLAAVRTGRDGPQRRQPRRASAAVVAALGVAMGLTGFAYGWWLSVLGVYLLGVAAWLVRGERLRPGARPWPVALGDAEPAGQPVLVYHGSSIGTAVPIPADHAAHGPPTPRTPPPPEPPGRLRNTVVLILLVAAARAVKNVLRGKPRR
ncbi:MAG TPA: hypothetical protein VN748_23090 [Pseudonocardiaceae bacterium]|jgi:hypothetical protein|nr:hypothetical protein [Pseudonocardiaceae bacterium]